MYKNEICLGPTKTLIWAWLIVNYYCFLNENNLMQIFEGPAHDNNYTDIIFVSHYQFAVDVKVDIPLFTSGHCT